MPTQNIKFNRTDPSTSATKGGFSLREIGKKNNLEKKINIPRIAIHSLLKLLLLVAFPMHASSTAPEVPLSFLGTIANATKYPVLCSFVFEVKPYVDEQTGKDFTGTQLRVDSFLNPTTEDGQIRLPLIKVGTNENPEWFLRAIRAHLLAGQCRIQDPHPTGKTFTLKSNPDHSVKYGLSVITQPKNTDISFVNNTDKVIKLIATFTALECYNKEKNIQEKPSYRFENYLNPQERCSVNNPTLADEYVLPENTTNITFALALQLQIIDKFASYEGNETDVSGSSYLVGLSDDGKLSIIKLQPRDQAND